jgi:magnesium-transporting ATPase (P-type)
MDRQVRKEKRDAKIMGWVCLIIGILAIAFIITGIILGYFVSYVGADGDEYDGFGRLIDTVPGAMSMILLQWAGFIWFFIDLIIIFSLIILIDRMFVRSKLYFTGIKHVDF